MPIPQEFITQLLNRVDIIDIIDERVPLIKRGANHQACCPFHNEKSPSFSVSQTKQFYHCFGCQANGNAISFIMAYDNLGFTEVVDILAKSQGLTVPTTGNNRKYDNSDSYDALSQAKHFYQLQLRTHPKKALAVDYFKARGLTGEIAKQYALGYAPEGWDNLKKSSTNNKVHQQWQETGLLIQKENGNSYDRFRQRVMFPIRNTRGQVIGFGGRVLNDEQPKYLNSPESKIFHKRYALYGLYEALQLNRHLDKILICEGYMDVIALAKAGFTNAVATLGTAVTEHHIEQLMKHSKKLIFCFDGDKAGLAAAWRSLEMCLGVLHDGLTIRFLLLDEDKDPDNIVQTQGAEAFGNMLENAMSLTDFFLKELSERHLSTHVEGKAEFLREVKIYLDKMPHNAKAYKQLFVERIARLVHLSPERTHTLLFDAPNNTVTTKAKVSLDSFEKCIAIVMQSPLLHERVPSQLLSQTHPLSGLFKDVIEKIKQSPDITTGGLLGYYQQSKYGEIVQNLTSYDISNPDEDLKATLDGQIELIQKQSTQRRTKFLLNKANHSPLNEAEKSELRALIELKSATQVNIST